MKMTRSPSSNASRGGIGPSNLGMGFWGLARPYRAISRKVILHIKHNLEEIVYKKPTSQADKNRPTDSLIKRERERESGEIIIRL